MSGTSLDGIDAALLRTDGEAIADFGPGLTLPYEPGLRARIRACLGGGGAIAAVSRALTEAHAEAVAALLRQAGMAAADVA
ncbi:anhydro-N-acetylmuramic acid kinase, partial [Ferrovibrio sp.]|uniref:anhydro-N-acetylmuramic acid kinase n=1 Tax=Ferrovibrio sp. TaxID=1917215 RepID=UPI00311E2E38